MPVNSVMARRCWLMRFRRLVTDLRLQLQELAHPLTPETPYLRSPTAGCIVPDQLLHPFACRVPAARRFLVLILRSGVLCFVWTDDRAALRACVPGTPSPDIAAGNGTGGVQENGNHSEQVALPTPRR